jgi:hypothetical protein
MHFDLNVKCPTLSSALNTAQIVSTRVSIKSPKLNFTNTLPMGAGLMRADNQMDL